MIFELTGKLKLGQESDKFKPYQERIFESGWASRTLLFNAICGDNRHMLQIQGGTYPEKKDYKIITVGLSTTDVDGTRHAGERLEIPWKDRFLESNIAKVAEFKRFVVDLEESGRRTLLTQYADRINEGGSLTDEELAKVGLKEEGEIDEALKKSKELRKEFISAWDQAVFVKKMLESDKYKDRIFFIKGTFNCQYSDTKQQWYINMVPQKITLAKPGAEESSIGKATLLFGPGAVDDLSLEEKGKYFIKAYTMEYDSARKKNIPCEFQLVIPKGIANTKGEHDSGDEGRAKKLVSKFVVEDDSVKELGIEFDILNGSQRVEITEDMLTDEQKEDLELGLISMDDIKRDLGDTVYGDRIRENRYKRFMRGYGSGTRKDTAYSVEDLEIPPLDEDLDGLFDTEKVKESEDDDDDIFS